MTTLPSRVITVVGTILLLSGTLWYAAAIFRLHSHPLILAIAEQASERTVVRRTLGERPTLGWNVGLVRQKGKKRPLLTATLTLHGNGAKCFIRARAAEPKASESYKIGKIVTRCSANKATLTLPSK